MAEEPGFTSRQTSIIGFVLALVVAGLLHGDLSDRSGSRQPDAVPKMLLLSHFDRLGELAEDLRSGDLHFWHSHGRDAWVWLTNINSGWAHPPDVFTALMGSFVGIERALQGLLFVLSVFAFATTFQLARKLGSSLLASFFSSSIFTLSSALVGRVASGDLQSSEAAAWIPAIGLALFLVSRRWGGRSLAVLSVVLVLASGTGCFVLIVISLLLLSLTVRSTASESRAGPIRFFAGVLGATCVSMLLLAPWTLPAYLCGEPQFAGHGGSVLLEAGPSILSPLALLEGWIPGLLGNGVTREFVPGGGSFDSWSYLGLFPILCILRTFIIHDRSRVLILSCLGLFLIVMAQGYLDVLGFPVLGSAPSDVASSVILALALPLSLLAGKGLDSLGTSGSNDSDAESFSRWGGAGLLALSLLLVISMHHDPDGSGLSQASRSLLRIQDSILLARDPGSSMVRLEDVRVFRRSVDAAGWRFIKMASVVGFTLISLGFGIYHRARLLLILVIVTCVDLLNVARLGLDVISVRGDSSISDRSRIHESPDAQPVVGQSSPRVTNAQRQFEALAPFWTRRVRVSDRNEVNDWSPPDPLDANQEIVVDYPEMLSRYPEMLSTAEQSQSQSKSQSQSQSNQRTIKRPPRLKVSQSGPDFLEITLTSILPGWIIIPQNFHRGWRLELDGRDRPIGRAAGWAQSFPVNASNRRAVLRFYPRGFTLSIALFALGSMLVVIGITRKSKEKVH